MSGFGYRWRLWRLQSNWDDLSTKYREDAAVLKKERKLDDAQQLDNEEFQEYQLHRDAVDALQTRYLVEKAERLDIPIPEFLHGPSQPGEVDAWKKSSINYQFHLTVKARAELRALIRKEKNERTETAFKWVPAVTGLIGALIGLLAILHSH